MKKAVKTILLALDLGPDSEAVAQWAQTLAEAAEARVVALHVVVGLEDVMEFEFPYVTYDEDFDDLNAKAQTSLERFLAEHLKGVSAEARIVDGKPAKQILRVAGEVGADLIVMGTHESRGLERVIYGSPAQQVMFKTRVPMVAVPLGLSD